MYRISFLVIAACVGLTAFADESTLGKFAFGLEVGVDFGNATSVNQISSWSRTGYALGVSVDTGLTDIFSLQPELLFVQDGNEVTDTSGVRIRTSFQSLQIPVMLKARLGQWKFAPYLFAGPVANVRLGSSVETVNAGTSSNVKLKNWDFGLAGGVGLDFDIFFANLRYNLGLTNLANSGADFRSRGILFMAGLRL